MFDFVKILDLGEVDVVQPWTHWPRYMIPFSLEECDYYAYRRDRHYATEMASQGFVCPHCRQSFLDASALTRHIESHDPADKQDFKCEEWGHTTSRAEFLTFHLNTHIKKVDKKFLCKTCGQNFTGSRALQAHTGQHTQGEVESHLYYTNQKLEGDGKRHPNFFEGRYMVFIYAPTNTLHCIESYNSIQLQITSSINILTLTSTLKSHTLTDSPLTSQPSSWPF